MSEIDERASDHPAETDFEAFVTGALVGGAAEAFEAHVAGCDACAARLANEAVLEEKLHEVAAHRAATERAPVAEPARVTSLRPRLGRVAAAAAGLAVAAGVAFVLTREAEPPGRRDAVVATPRPSAIPAVVCADLAEQAACIERAHRRGLYVRYPTGAGAPPIGGASTGGPSSSPFPVSKRTP